MELDSERDDNVAVPREGRDELNLAEFPIALLASRPDKTLKTLHFQDRIWDKARHGWTTRQLTVSASDHYGLPTALDDEVILGLIQLTREDDFESRTVFFSRYHLIRLLGWRNEGKSYERLDTSLRRWLGVTFYYENAWWDKAAGAWVDEHFHLLEHVAVYDRERRLQKSGGCEPALSAFTWNEVVFRSFQAGYLKRIDMELFRRLGSSIAKRLYRLLDKRFYHKTAWEFDLRKLACEHVGLSRKYDIGQLKRRLNPAILELEQQGYLAPAPPEERFVRVDAGLWQVRFRKAARKSKTRADKPASDRLKAELVARGVNSVTAGRLILEYPPSEIARRIKVLDWLLNQRGQPAPRNPAGYLVQSIREGYDVPAAFGTGDRGASPARAIGAGAGRRQARAVSTEARVAQYLKSISPERRQSLEQAALAAADPNVAQWYERAVSEGPKLLADVYRHLILAKHVLATMGLDHGTGSSGKRTA